MSKQTRNHLHFLELHSLLMREIHFIIFNFILIIIIKIKIIVLKN